MIIKERGEREGKDIKERIQCMYKPKKKTKWKEEREREKKEKGMKRSCSSC